MSHFRLLVVIVLEKVYRNLEMMSRYISNLISNKCSENFLRGLNIIFILIKNY